MNHEKNTLLTRSILILTILAVVLFTQRLQAQNQVWFHPGLPPGTQTIAQVVADIPDPASVPSPDGDTKNAPQIQQMVKEWTWWGRQATNKNRDYVVWHLQEKLKHDMAEYRATMRGSSGGSDEQVTAFMINYLAMEVKPWIERLAKAKLN